MKPADKASGGGRKEKSGKPCASKCAICGKPVVHAYRPFCSRRCADIDLGRWLKGKYAVPGESAETSKSTSEEH